MPIQTRVPTTKEIVIYREEAQTTILHVLDLLLRAGARGLVEFQHDLMKFTEANQTKLGTYLRVNPEDLKAVFRRCGVMLKEEEHLSILLAYSDTVGFVLVEPLLAVLSPVGQLSGEMDQLLRSLFPSTGTSSDAAGSLNVTLTLPSLELSSLLDLFVALFCPLSEEEEAREGGEANPVGINNINAALQIAYEEAAQSFSRNTHPSEDVPGLEVMHYLAALLFMNKNNKGLVRTLLGRLRSGTMPKLVPYNPVAHPAGSSPRAPRPEPAYSLVHQGVRQDRKFERYYDEDRRDMWLRGREEHDARMAYMKHTVGYGGHLPEYRYHFGRTFHIIEEDLPELTRPKPPIQEEVALDCYGPGVELKNSRMSAHHYKFS